MEAKKRVAAPWGRPIGAFGCAGRLSVTEAQSGGQSRLQLGKPGKVGLATVKRFVATLLSLLVVSPAHATEIRPMGEQLILSGPVVAGDYEAVASSLSFNPQTKTIILRNSPGGDAPTGYHLGELFRQKSLETAVSGFCYSSCSRLFLGGKERYFTDDYPPEYTQIGLHGHYDGKGDLNAASLNALHLKDWIICYSDGRADDALVDGSTYLAERG